MPVTCGIWHDVLAAAYQIELYPSIYAARISAVSREVFFGFLFVGFFFFFKFSLYPMQFTHGLREISAAIKPFPSGSFSIAVLLQASPLL